MVVYVVGRRGWVGGWEGWREAALLALWEEGWMVFLVHGRRVRKRTDRIITGRTGSGERSKQRPNQPTPTPTHSLLAVVVCLVFFFGFLSRFTLAPG